jgi:hypothetical protein
LDADRLLPGARARGSPPVLGEVIGQVFAGALAAGALLSGGGGPDRRVPVIESRMNLRLIVYVRTGKVKVCADEYELD